MRKLITLNMIVKDEEALLGECLKSIKGFVDEIIIVDTGSSDRTVGVARKHGAIVHHFKWCNDFAIARNYALSHVKTPWVMWLDADDLVVNPEYLKEIIEVAHRQQCNAVWTLYQQDKNCIQRRMHIFKTKDFRWSGAVHENPIAKRGEARSYMADISVLHRKPVERSPLSAKQYLEILLDKDPENWFGLAESYRFLSHYPDDTTKVTYYTNEADRCYWEAFNYPDANIQTKYICLLQLAELNWQRRSDYSKKIKLTETFTADNYIYLEAATRYAQLGIALCPDRAECWTVLGQCWHSQGLFDRAREAYTTALQCVLPTDEVGLVYHSYYKVLPEQYLKLLDETEKDERKQGLIITPEKAISPQ